MKPVGTLLSKLVTVATVVAAVAVILMIVHITLDVLLRNLVRSPIPATPSIVANYYMAAVSFLPVALAEKLDQHIAVDVVFEMFPTRLQKWALRCVRLLIAVVTGAAACGFLFDAIEKYQMNSYVLETDVRVPDWPGYFMLPIGFGLWALICLFKVVASFSPMEKEILDHLRPAPRTPSEG